jgi:hypothetical protein
VPGAGDAMPGRIVMPGRQDQHIGRDVGQGELHRARDAGARAGHRLAFAQPDGAAVRACLDHVDVEQRHKRQALLDMLPDVAQRPPYIPHIQPYYPVT